MKKNLCISFLLCYLVAWSQVGVNTSYPQKPFHVDGAKDNGNGIPSATQASNDFVIDEKGFVGIGTLNPQVRLDLRSASATAPNTIGIGFTPQTASEAGAGALRYAPVNGGVMQYSDGTKWIELKTPAIAKTNVVARINAAGFQPQYQFPFNTAKEVTQFEEITDNLNAFDPVSGVFKAPRDGVYLVNFSYNMVAAFINKNSSIEISVDKTGSSNVSRKCRRSLASYGGSGTTNARQAQVGGFCIKTFPVKAGDEVRVTITQNTHNGNLSMDLPDAPGVSNPLHPNRGFNRLTVIEQ